MTAPATNRISRRGFLKGAGASAALASGATLTGRTAASARADETPATPAAPRYIFLFIGDGMGLPQIQLARYYVGALEHDGAPVPAELSFTQFPHGGSVTTYDSTSFCPDSASTATSIATGRKTHSGVINMDPETTTEPFVTVSEQLHEQMGYRVGVLTTVNLNHATPAAFYAHQASRGNYYEIGEELAASGFEYFAGGAFLKPCGADGDKPHILEVVADAGYTVVTTQAEAEALEPGAGKAVLVSEVTADGDAMNYSLDASAGEWQLSDYVRKGVEMLGDGEPFFMMAEAGKIDWACHANDAAASIHDVLELDRAVAEAVAFYEQHPDETLVLVTADHETGGLSIGYATTNYDTFLPNLACQTVSYAAFDTQHVTRYREEQTPFADVLADVKACFGLMTAGDADAASADEAGVNGSLVLSDYELEQLQDAYERTLAVGEDAQDQMEQRDYELYGTYQPFSAALCHILNHKSGVDHTTYAHTGAPVALYALGCGAEAFDGAYDNTRIYEKLAALTGIA